MQQFKDKQRQCVKRQVGVGSQRKLGAANNVLSADQTSRQQWRRTDEPVFPRLHAKAVNQIVRWLPVVERFVAVRDWREERAHQIGRRQQRKEQPERGERLFVRHSLLVSIVAMGGNTSVCRASNGVAR